MGWISILLSGISAIWLVGICYWLWSAFSGVPAMEQHAQVEVAREMARYLETDPAPSRALAAVSETAGPFVETSAEIPGFEAPPKERLNFAEVSTTLEEVAKRPIHLAERLDTLFEKVDWSDATQTEPLTEILQSIFKNNEESRSILEPYLERESFKYQLLATNDPVAFERVLDTYFNVVDDGRLQKRFILRMRRYQESDVSTAYFDNLYARVTGHPPSPEEISAEEDDLSPNAGEIPSDQVL